MVAQIQKLSTRGEGQPSIKSLLTRYYAPPLLPRVKNIIIHIQQI